MRRPPLEWVVWLRLMPWPWQLPQYPETLADDLIAQASAQLPIARALFRTKKERTFYIACEWIPEGWWSFWYELLAESDRMLLARTLLDGTPYDALRLRLRAFYRFRQHDSVPHVWTAYRADTSSRGTRRLAGRVRQRP